MKNSTTDQAKKRSNNPTGKGGFGDHPENISPGGWNPENTFSYQFNKFKNMTKKEFDEYKKTHPKSERTMAEALAYARVVEAQNKLRDFQEVANRTEGMPLQKNETDANIKLGLYDQNKYQDLLTAEREALDRIFELGKKEGANRRKK